MNSISKTFNQMDFREFLKKYQKIRPEEFTNSSAFEPTVSVCVQTYQHADFIKDCLDGILRQETSFPFEVLLGEDASTDGTREICKEYAQKYPDKVRLFLHHRENNIKINGKPTGRFNFLYNLYSAKGKYVALCEGDDYWTDSLKLQKQVDFLEANPDYNICFHNVSVLFNECKRLEPDLITRTVPETTDISDLVGGNFIHTPSVILRNNFSIPDWFTKSLIGDWSLYVIMLGDKKIFKINQRMGVYRIHGTSLWSSIDQVRRIRLTKESFEMVEKNIDFPPETKRILRETVKKYNKSSNRFKIFYSNLTSYFKIKHV